MIETTIISTVSPRSVCLVICLCVLVSAPGTRAVAQSSGQISERKRIAFDWTDSGKGSAAVKERVAGKLKAFRKIEIVSNPAQADAIVHGSATIWATEYISTSPRSRGAEQAVYQGYATAELTSHDGKTLWSYLVTPRRAGWKGITDDLGDQLGTALIAVLEHPDPEKNTPATAEAHEGGNAALAPVRLEGAGATFPAPLYQKWFESFSRTRPAVRIDYEAVGSEEGLRRIRADQVDFGASDVSLSAEQLQRDGRLLQFATVLGAVVPIYNVKGAPDGLNLSPEVLAGIFFGRIHSWNAPEIRSINKHVRLPEENIVVVHRSDGSGTTYAWTDYLSKVNAEWKSNVGKGTTVSWPVGVGAERNQGVADTVFKTPNSIGYVEFIYALQHELSFAAVRNRSGEYVKADLDSVTAAAKAAGTADENALQTSITDAAGKHTYPISTFTWVLIPATGTDAKKHEATRELLRWMLTSGQKECQFLGYAPLPGDLAARELQALNGTK